MIGDSVSLEDARLFASWLTMNGKLIFIDAKQPQRTLTCYLLQMCCCKQPATTTLPLSAFIIIVCPFSST